MNERQFYHVQRLTMSLAVFLIAFGCTGFDGMLSFLERPSPLAFYPQLILAMISMTGANFLMMALGANQLRAPRLSSARLGRLLLWLTAGIIVFTLIIYLEEFTMTKTVTHFSWGNFWRVLVATPDSFYDVLYAILGFFIALPLLRKLAIHAPSRVIHALFWTQLLVVGIIPLIIFYVGLRTVDNSPLIAIINGWFFALMGYWLANRNWIWRVTREQLLIAWLLTVACYAVMISTTKYQANLAQNYGVIGSLAFAQTLQAIPCLTVWVTLTARVLNHPNLPKPRRFNFLRGSYATLVMVGILLTPLQFISKWGKPWLGAWWSGLVWVLVTLAVSQLLVWLLRRLPFFKRLWPDLFYGTEILG